MKAPCCTLLAALSLAVLCLGSARAARADTVVGGAVVDFVYAGRGILSIGASGSGLGATGAIQFGWKGADYIADAITVLVSFDQTEGDVWGVITNSSTGDLVGDLIRVYLPPSGDTHIFFIGVREDGGPVVSGQFRFSN